MKKLKLVCPDCLSEKISVPGWFRWDISEQKFVEDDITDDQDYCLDCDRIIGIADEVLFDKL